MADWPSAKGASILLVFPFYDGSGCPVKGGGGLAACVSKDGGAFSVTACGSALAEINTNAGLYKLTLLDDEMNADVVAWKAVSTTASARDAIGVIYTATRQLKDLAFPTVTGRSIDVDANGGVEVGSFQASAITASTFTASSVDAAAFAQVAACKVWDAAVRTITGTVTVGTNNDKTGYSIAASGITASSFTASSVDAAAFAQVAACKVWDAAVRTITGTVTVGTNNDKTGYSLAASAITASTFTASAIDKEAIGLAGASQIWNVAVRGVTDIAASAITNSEFTDSAASRVADIAIKTITLAELAVGQPATTPTVAEALMFPYMSLRNTASTFSGCIKITNDAGTVIASAAMSESGSIFERGKWVSG